MKFYISTSKTRQAKVVHADKNCQPLSAKACGITEVDPATLRVFVRCKYCYGNRGGQ